MKKTYISALLTFAHFFLSAQAEFITTWKTDNPGISNDNQITIPTFSGETYNYTIDWGDGTSDSNVTGDITHTYINPGTYTVKITGDFPRIYFFGSSWLDNTPMDNKKLVTVAQWGSIEWTSMEFAFLNCTEMEVTALDVPDLSHTTNLNAMFKGCKAMQGSAAFSEWEVDSIQLMNSLFASCFNFNQDIGDWNVNNVTDMSFMFSDAHKFNSYIGSWDVSKVTNMRATFQAAWVFDQNIGGWDVSQVGDMSNMFLDATFFNQDIGNWNTRRVSTMNAMFAVASTFNQDIGNWHVSLVADMSDMFFNAVSFDQNLGNWDMEQVVSLSGMFTQASLSKNNYDNTLVGWSNQTVTNNLVFDGGNSRYCASTKARQSLIDDFGWVITDGGKDCPFITTWKTDHPGATSDDRIRIPTFSGDTYNYTISWGDGTSDTGVTGNITHQYATPGTYTISISGDFPRIYFNDFKGTTNDSDKIISIDQWGSGKWTSMDNAFTHCSNLDVLATDIPNLENAHSLGAMFRFCESLIGNESFSDWQVSTITSFGFMFHGASQFNQDIGSWDVSNATYLSYMFSGAKNFNSDISNWDIRNVEYLDLMFGGASSFNQPIGKWDTQNLTSLHAMFGGASAFNQDISTWNVSNIQQMGAMFSGATSFNQDISNWDVSNVTGMNSMFHDATSFNQPIGKWDVSAVTDMTAMIYGATSFNQPLNNWDISNVMYMSSMFASATSFNQPLNNWDVSNVTTTSGMFLKASSFNQDISNWDMGNVTAMGGMFNQAVSFDQNLGKWDVSKVTTMDYLFSSTGLSLENYDKTILGWNDLPSLQRDVVLNAGYSQYCEAEEARQYIINNYGWIISDEGKAPLCSEDYDSDGVLDHIDACLDTPPGVEVNANGCSFIQNDGIYVYALTPSCVGSSDGAIEITTATVDHLLDISIEGENISNRFDNIASDTGFRIGDLAIGVYNVTVSIPEAQFERTYGIAINALNSLSGKRTSLDSKSGTVSYSVVGSKNYKVSINGQKTDFTFEHSGQQIISLENLKGQNEVTIAGESDCQGTITDRFFMGNSIQVFPTIASANVNVLTNGDQLKVWVYSQDGKLIKELNYRQRENPLDISMLKTGVYFLRMSMGNKEETVKIIKQ